MEASRIDLAVWSRLAEPDGEELLGEIGRLDTLGPAAIERLRRRWDTGLVQAALELHQARDRATKKFADGRRLFLDRAGVEQASGEGVASYKAERFRGVADRGIVDLCCGVGGDALALAPVGQLLAVDRDPARRWMCERNLSLRGFSATSEVICEDVGAVDVAGRAVHVDPARRREGSGGRRRLWRYSDFEPGPSELERIFASTPDVAVKLGPGLDPQELPLQPTDELEWISHGGQLVQAIWWRGALSQHPGQRTATLLPEVETWSGNEFVPCEVHTCHDDGDYDSVRYLATADASLERSGLLGAWSREHELQELAPGLGVLVAAEPREIGMCEWFQVQTTLPWRRDRVRGWLHSHDAGNVAVKTRGGFVDANSEARKLSGGGDQAYVVFVLRQGKKARAWVTCRASGRTGL